MATVLMVLYLLVGIALTAVVVLQKSKGEGLGSIGGSAQMFFNRPKGFEAVLERATTILAVAFMVLSVALVMVS